jgi:hypothetical protein
VQVRDVDVVVVRDDVVVVGITMIAVEVVGLDDVEVEGCTYVTDVPATTPIAG